MKSISRKLGLVEKWMELGHELGSGLIVNIAEIEGDVKPEIVQQALKLVQKRHPMLQVYIVETEDGMYFQSEGITEIPLQVIYQKHENEGWKIAEKELHTKFPPGKIPLCRLTLLYSPENQTTCQMIITFHHGIVDGISCMQFINDLLLYCQKIVAGENIPQVESLELMPAIENLVNYDLIPEAEITKTSVNEQINLEPQLIIEGKASANERFSKILPRNLSQDMTKMLITKCKQEETTVHGAICAAMLFAFRKLLNAKEHINLSYGLPVNLRKSCQPEINTQNLGCFISVLGFNQLVGKNTSFWDLARECKSKIHNSLISGIPLNLLKQNRFRSPDRELMAKSVISKEDKMGRNNAFAISNRGKFQFEYKQEQIKIKDLYFATGQHLGGDCFWLGVVTLNDQIFFSFVYVDPVISDQTANKFADYVIHILHNSCTK
ncbi:condensation domain-containing protein [Sphaerospermopsis sp. LEGE 08334]|jgi:NRPS condensation-like uncharacterized protein|uniref:condensation domain-containing protein n=1 Tax=Sphaerospermopsis sp. LEGE 08334 TaxID=1828651 RepID=UPI0018811412|nr:condensation domain-containing protein [Sphaerospermopsis sp. LEGE 08334]MBE9056063.1 condensation protein [Sphaerospermopsis sp. LEGE 08334]